MSDTHNTHDNHNHEPANLPTLEIPKAGEHHDHGSHMSHSHGTSSHVSTHNDHDSHGGEESQPSLVATVLRFLIVAAILIGLFVLLWWLSRTLISSRGRTPVADTNIASTQTDIRNAFSGSNGGSLVPDSGSPVLGTSTTAFPDPVVTPPVQTPPPAATPAPTAQPAVSPATTYSSPNGGYYIDIPAGWQVDGTQSGGTRTVLQGPSGSGYVESYDNRSGETLDSVTHTLQSTSDVYDISPTNVYGVPATYFRSSGNRSGIVVVNAGRIYYLRGILSTGSHVGLFHFN